MSEAPRHLHVDLEFEVGSEPISGTLSTHPLLTREFRGWIEFAAVLDALITAPQQERAAPPDS